MLLGRGLIPIVVISRGVQRKVKGEKSFMSPRSLSCGEFGRREVPARGREGFGTWDGAEEGGIPAQPGDQEVPPFRPQP